MVRNLKIQQYMNIANSCVSVCDFAVDITRFPKKQLKDNM